MITLNKKLKKTYKTLNKSTHPTVIIQDIHSIVQCRFLLFLYFIKKLNIINIHIHIFCIFKLSFSSRNT